MDTKIVIIGILLGLSIFFTGCIFSTTPANVWSECRNDSANVFIGANENLKNVKCVALDKEFFDNQEIVIGNLSKDDEDVCRFRLSKDTTQPLRFEVWYNGKVKREVCDWQHYSGGID